jgi:hypothetical protein
MNKQAILYLVVGVAALIFAIGFLLSQYVEYKQYRLSQEKAIQDCIEKTVGTNTTGFTASNAKQKCIEKFSQ